MKHDDDHDGVQNERLRNLCETTSAKTAIWIDDDSGQLVDSFPIESRIRPGSGGCQLCHEELDANAVPARLEFDDHHLPKLIVGSGAPVCEQCVEWIRLLHYHAENGSVGVPRFDDGDLVVRAGIDELYEVLEARLTGVASIGVFFPTYTCQRIEIQKGSGKILSAYMGLIFEIPDCELQPLPPRYAFARPQHRIKECRGPIDLVGYCADPRPALPARAPSIPQSVLPARRPPLLLGKRGGP
jgi:hypothetical protein